MLKPNKRLLKQTTRLTFLGMLLSLLQTVWLFVTIQKNKSSH